MHERFFADLFDRTGMDLRGEVFDPFYIGHFTSASSLELVDNQLEITIWKPGHGERTVTKT
jgi:hypothetical protein